MKNKNFEVLLLITLLSGICFKVSATKETGLVKYNPINNNIAKNKEITKFKESNGILTKTEKKIKEDQGKIYNLIIKDTSNNSSTYEERIYFGYILKILENEFNNKNNIKIENIFKNLNIEKNNGNIYVNFEITIPNEENISEKIYSFVVKNFFPKNINIAKENLKKIIDKYNLNEMKTDKDKIIDEEIEKLNRYEKDVENEYNQESFFDNPIKSFFGINSIFNNINKMFSNSILEHEALSPFDNNELEEIKGEVKKERKLKEKNDIKNKIEEKKARLRKLKNEKIDIEKLKNLIDNIENLNLDGNYYKMSESISSVSRNER